jgi:hypothetical protein
MSTTRLQKTLLQMDGEFARRGVRVAVVAATEDLRDEFARYGRDIHAVSVKAAVNALSAGNLYWGRRTLDVDGGHAAALVPGRDIRLASDEQTLMEVKL